MTGPKQAISNEEKKIHTTHSGRCLLGTSSAIATVKEICTAPASPPRILPPMRSSTRFAVAPIIAPIKANELPIMKNQRLPKISDSRPTIKKPTLRPKV